MHTKLAACLIAIALIAGGIYWYASRPAAKPIDPALPGAFTSTYMPAGWTKVEDDQVMTVVQSPDYATAQSVATNCADAGGADCGPAMVRGAQFTLAYDPCPADTAAGTEAWWQRQYTGNAGYIGQESITIAGHAATLFHSEWTTTTARPVTIEYYVAPIIAGDNCREAAYMFAASSSVAYQTKLQRFLDGVQFLPAAL